MEEIHAGTVGNLRVVVDESHCIVLEDARSNYRTTITDAKSLALALDNARALVQEAESGLWAPEAGSVRLDMLAYLALALVPVSLGLWCLSMLAGAVAGVV